ncbi:BMP family lipoprotein [Aureimonas leprariae]|uniref:BMP family ABC transporter substrate-binding protein n=1 Tax=Plantimonas leprariae TaxID=2615207 RepID=A0A7V7PSV3_9HYPH|nr:BMP family ABC transporter substrate-binding protein [Aureimonas leprariae]KAB0682719.1 BMP family ABC transporter substrate-binding protein [Aureimonas leprariae]
MKKTVLATLAASAIALCAALPAARAADAEPAIIYDLGGKFDKSFNEAGYNGAEKWKKDTGKSYREFEIQNDSQREQALRRFARNGSSPILAMSFSAASAVEKVAKEFPDTKFVIIDSVVDLPNVRSVLFSEEQGSYLVGMLAAMKSQTNKVGFVGGMDIPLIRNFSCGYKGGAKAAKADVQVFENMTGTTGAAWNDPVRGGELAKSQISQGADVIYHAAGGTGIGVLQAANDAGKYGIGVDSNQNMLHPGHVLTSMLKRVDVAVYKAFDDVAKGNWSAGNQTLGLKEDGVGYAVDDNNKDLITPEMANAVEQAKADIIAGKVQVHNYNSDDKCPY